MIRGYDNQKIADVADKIDQAFGVGTSTVTSTRSGYSAWTPDLNAPLLLYSLDVWKSLFGTEMILVRGSGGIEPSYLSVTYPDMQIFTYGPNIFDAHTVNEHVEILSIQRTWQYTLELLKSISKVSQ